MYSMNVMNFEAPEISISFVESEKKNVMEDAKIGNIILQHHFNSKVLLHIPDSSNVPESISKKLISDTSFYYVQNLQVEELCKYEFVKAFVECGDFYGYSPNCRLDIDDCAAFTPSGNLFLLLDSFRYHSFGISGKLYSHILRSPKNRYFIEIDTRASGYKPGKNLYEKVHTAFKNFSLMFDFYITWIPHDKNVCPSSVAKYFHDKGYSVEEVDPELSETRKVDVRIPNLSGADKEGLVDDTEAFLEWLGMLASDIPPSSCPNLWEATTSVSSMTVAHADGFFTPKNILETVDALRSWILERNAPWICLTVYGPPDGLISWSKTEHAFKCNGENFYVLVIERERTSCYVVEESRKPERFYVKSSNKKFG